MAYSISQISNVVRTYNQQLRVKSPPPLQGKPLGRAATGEDQVSISPEGRRLLEATEARHGAVGTFSRQTAGNGV